MQTKDIEVNQKGFWILEADQWMSKGFKTLVKERQPVYHWARRYDPGNNMAEGWLWIYLMVDVWQSGSSDVGFKVDSDAAAMRERSRGQAPIAGWTFSRHEQ
jgi:hypothetical protein